MIFQVVLALFSLNANALTVGNSCTPSFVVQDNLSCNQISGSTLSIQGALAPLYVEYVGPLTKPLYLLSGPAYMVPAGNSSGSNPYAANIQASVGDLELVGTGVSSISFNNMYAAGSINVSADNSVSTPIPSNLAFPQLTSARLLAITGAVSVVDFNSLGAVGVNTNTGNTSFNMQNMTATNLSFPMLTVLGGGVSLTGLNSLVTFNVPILARVAGSLTITSGPLWTTITFPSLASIGNNFAVSGGSATSLSFPVLSTVTGNFSPATFASVTTITFSSLTRVGGTFNPTGWPALTAMSFPSLTTVVGTFTPMPTSTLHACTTLNFPSLTAINGALSLSSATVMSSINFASLTTVPGNVFIGTMSALTSLNLNSLTSVTGSLIMSSMSSLATISLPALTTVTAQITFTSMTALTTVSMPALIASSSITCNGGTGAISSVFVGSATITKNINGNVNFGGQAMTQASVDQVLHTIASLDGTAGSASWGTGRTLTLNGGTNSTPSAAGLSDKATIVGRGGTVLNN